MMVVVGRLCFPHRRLTMDLNGAEETQFLEFRHGPIEGRLAEAFHPGSQPCLLDGHRTILSLKGFENDPLLFGQRLDIHDKSII